MDYLGLQLQSAEYIDIIQEAKVRKNWVIDHPNIYMRG